MVHDTSEHAIKIYVTMSLFIPSFVKHKDGQKMVRKGKSSVNRKCQNLETA